MYKLLGMYIYSIYRERENKKERETEREREKLFLDNTVSQIHIAHICVYKVLYTYIYIYISGTYHMYMYGRREEEPETLR